MWKDAKCIETNGIFHVYTSQVVFLGKGTGKERPQPRDGNETSEIVVSGIMLP